MAEVSIGERSTEEENSDEKIINGVHGNIDLWRIIVLNGPSRTAVCFAY